MLPQKELGEYVEQNCQKAEFRNEYGEQFTIYCDGITAFMKGDETDGEIVPLFSKEFNIWNKKEVYLLGEALMKLGEPPAGQKA